MHRQREQEGVFCGELACSVRRNPTTGRMPARCECCVVNTNRAVSVVAPISQHPFRLRRQLAFEKELALSRTVSVEMDRSFLIWCAFLAFALSASGLAVADDWKRLAESPPGDVEVRPALLEGVAEAARSGSNEDGAGGGELEDSAGRLAANARRLTSQPTAQKCRLDTPQEELEVDLDRYSLEAKFDCGLGETTNAVAPDCKNAATNSCCPSNDGTCTPTPILNAVGVNGSAVMNSSSNIVTVKLDDTPKKSDGKLYFKCTKSPTNTCIVTVNMPASLQTSKPEKAELH